jgi:hypothetical protein
MDTTTCFMNSRTCVPVRFFSEELHYLVDWQRVTVNGILNDEVIISNDTKKIKFYVGTNWYESNGVKKIMDSNSFFKDSRTFIPVRFFAEELGCIVNWEHTSKGDLVTILKR